MMPPSTGALAHGVAYLALVALVADTRWNPTAAREGVEGAGGSLGRRALGAEERVDALTASRVEAIVVDHLDAALAEMRGELAADRRESAQSLESVTDHLRARIQQLERDVDSLRSRGGARRMQTGDSTHETVDVHAEPAYILKREVTRITHDQSAGGGHRRAQSGDGYGDGGGACDAATLPSRTEAITTECCDEPSEDCSSGYPRTCNAGCAALFLPFWDECQLVLGKDIHNFEPVVQLCMAADGSSAPGSSGGSSLPFPVNGSLAQQLNVQCTDGTAAVDCIPECNAARHGFILLLNIEGNDSKLSCELHFELYSWIGAASDGGYIGTDFGSFFSAVVAGAAGTYFSTLTESHHVHTDLSCQPGQAVFIGGDHSLASAPTWGSGGFTVGEAASLSLSYLTIAGAISASLGAAQLSVSDCTLVDGGAMALQDVSATFTGTDFGGRSLSSSDGGSVSIASSLGSIGGIAVADSTFALDAASTVNLGGSISLANAGEVILSQKTFTDAALTVSGSTALTLSQITRTDGTLLVDSAVYTLGRVVPASSPDLACVSSQILDEDCNASGGSAAGCVDGACVCDTGPTGWSGNRCETNLPYCSDPTACTYAAEHSVNGLGMGCRSPSLLALASTWAAPVSLLFWNMHQRRRVGR